MRTVYYNEMYNAFVLLEGNDGISPITVLIIIMTTKFTLGIIFNLLMMFISMSALSHHTLFHVQCLVHVIYIFYIRETLTLMLYTITF